MVFLKWSLNNVCFLWFNITFQKISIIYIDVYVTDFLKTSPTKFAVVWVKRLQKAGYLSAKGSKITVTKEKERRKRKSEERKGGEKRKKQWLHS